MTPETRDDRTPAGRRRANHQGKGSMRRAQVATTRTTPSGEGRIDLSTTEAASDTAVSKCSELLQRAVHALAGVDGALFVVGSERVFEAVATHRDWSTWLVGPLKEAARSALRAQGPVLSVVVSGPEQPLSVTPERYLALPLDVEGELLGVLIVTGLPANGASVTAALDRLGQLPELLVLNLDRLRILWALDKRGEDLTALRRQLDAFVAGPQSTHQTERDGSRQLTRAVGELERTYRSTVSGLAVALEDNDEGKGGHPYRVSRYGMLVTSLVAPEYAGDPQFEYGFFLHDIGKLMVPDDVLNKPGALNDGEWDIMRAHPDSGRSILDGISSLVLAREIVHSHHERWDGKGYPRGLKGTEITLGARILALCDAFDAMTSGRPYRRAMPLDAALAQIRDGSGTQFWPEAVVAFLSLPRHELELIMGEKRCGPS